MNIPLRNRTAQADQARSQMEYRQTQMRLQQLYTQMRIQVINAQYALTNDRAQVQAAQAARDFAAQSPGGGAEEVQAGCFDDGERAAAGAQPGDGGEQPDLGDGGVCAGPRRRWSRFCRTRWTATASAWWMRRAGTVTQAPDDSGADGAEGSGSRRSR